MPFAVNGSSVPFAIVGFVGLTWIEFSTAAVTVTVTEPASMVVGSVAETTAVPTATALTSPSEPAAFETLATPDAVELHVSVVVRSLVVPSLYVPIARRGSVVPFAIVGSLGDTSIATRVAAVTVNVVWPLTIGIPGAVAVIVVVPTPTPLAVPSLPAALEIVATESTVDDQLTAVVRSWVLPSL
jgi:hypothetical protein